MYPRPSTAAPTFILKTNFALSAMATPIGATFEVKTSDHRPNVDTIKS